jgi:CubicO group peptidase (beta-lactamase class C family)
MNLKFRLALIVLVNLIATTTFAQQNQTRVESVIKIIEKVYHNSYAKNHIPGAAFGVVVNGKLVNSNYFGLSDIEKNLTVTKETVFRIASMTKSFTALAILQLRDAGKLSLDKPAHVYYPLLKKLQYPTADAPVITVRDLLTHSAGFPEDNPWGDRQLAKNDNDLISLLQQQISFSTTPQISYEYSNLGFALLGKIISNVSGMPYQQYIAKNIWQPLGMKNTYWEYSKVPSANLAKGYKYYNNTWVQQEMLPDAPNGSWGAMGAMLTTIEDFSKYIALHQNAYTNIKNSLVLKNSSLREMHQPWRLRNFNPTAKKANGKTCGFVQGYGYGLVYQKDCDGVEWIGHAGGLPGFGSQWRFLPQYGVAIVAFGNRTYAPFTAINNMVLDTLMLEGKLSPKSLEPSAILLQRQKELVEYLPNLNAAKLPNIFAENFFLDNPVNDFISLAKTKFLAIGKIKLIEKMEPENNLRGSFRVVGEKGALQIYFTLTPQQQPLIQQLDFL